jgi:aminoglycoside-2''-adenylyltransferase
MALPVKFYREVLGALVEADVPFLVGGAYAFCRHAAIDRKTKDLDLMVREETWPAVARALRARGIHTRRSFPHWLGKALSPGGQVDIIYNGGSGITRVDDEWFAHAVPATVLGYPVLLCPAEELLWSKAFIMERERFDGGDVLHLIRAHAERLDWGRLCRRFDGHEPVLLAHLTLFRYVYPSEAARVPSWVMPALRASALRLDTDARLCRGPLISRAQYLVDVEEWGYADARLPPHGKMSDRDWLQWTNAIDARQSRVRGGVRTSAPRRADGTHRKAS